MRAQQGETQSVLVLTGFLEFGLRVSFVIPDGVWPDGYSLDSYRWIRVDGDIETEIHGSDSTFGRYKIKRADVGKRLKAEVRLRDGPSDAASLLVLTSEVSGVVRAAPSYLSSNLSQADDNVVTASPFDTDSTAIAQQFRTGAAPAELSAVRVRMLTIDGYSPKVSIYSDDSNEPSRSLHVLTNPSAEALQDGDDSFSPHFLTKVFTATGVTLSASTIYWLVFEQMSVGGTTSDFETGWFITNPHKKKDSGGDWSGIAPSPLYFLQFGLLGPQTASAPSFATKPLTFSVNENAAPGTVVGTAGATDADGDPPAYSVSGTDAEAFAQVFIMNMDSGGIKVREGATVDHESKGSYEVTINVTDGEDASGVTEDAATIDDTVVLTINVTDVQEPGAVALSPVTPAVDRPVTATLADPDGSVSGETWIWSWASTPGGSFTTISGANTTSYMPVAGDAGRYLKAAVSYTDSFGSGQSAEQVSANAVAVNPAPVFARPSMTFTVFENTTSGTVGVVTATDPEGETITYSVGGADLAARRAFNGDFSLNAATGAITVKSGATFDHESAPTYTVVITATDTSGVTAKVNVTINVIDVNEPGMVDLPVSPSVVRSLTATLTDPDGAVGNVTWHWSKASTRTGSFTTIAGETGDSYRPVEDDVDWFLKATASYRDDSGPGQSATETTITAVSADPTPQFRDASVTFTVDENSTPGEGETRIEVGRLGHVDIGESTTSLRYSIDGPDVVAFNEDFTLNGGRITIERRDGPIDYEERRSYSVRGTVTNSGGAIDTIDIIINVTDVNEPGAVALSPVTPAVGRPVTATLTEADVDYIGETWVWSWATSPNGPFTTISGANSATYTPVAADGGRYLKAAVSYTDIFGPGQTAEQVPTNAVLTNPAPVFADTFPTFTVEENATSGTVGTVTATDPENEAVTYSVGGADAAAFNLHFDLDSTSGEITVKPAPTFKINFEGRSSYSITITATDTASGTATVDITINVIDVNEPGTVDLFPATPGLGSFLGANLADPDRHGLGTWTWSRGSSRTGSFTTIEGADSAEYGRPVLEDMGHFLRATVTYTDVHGPGQSASATTLTAVPLNQPPAFAGESVTFTVNEDVTGGTVGTVTATDPEPGFNLTYSVGGDGAKAFNGAFGLSRFQGEITVHGGAQFHGDPSIRTSNINYEDRSSYSVTVTATDPFGGADTISVTINVINVDEPGVVTLSRATPGVGTSLTATMRDPDGGVSGETWTWAWSTTRTGSFTTISGASGAAYTPVAGDLGRYLKASVSYTDALGSGKTADMTSVDAVVASGQIPLNQIAQGLPTLWGTVEAGLRVRPDTSGITDGNGLGSFSYQWVLVDSGTPIDITGPFGKLEYFDIRPEDAGKALRLRVSFTDGDGYLETVTSADVVVAAPPPYLVSNLTFGSAINFFQSAIRFYLTGSPIDGQEVFQSFTTGASAGRLDGVRLGMRGWDVSADEAVAVPGGAVRVSIWSHSNASPAARQLVLTSPAEIDDSLATLEFFSTNGATLNPNTTYWVGIEALGETRIDTRWNGSVGFPDQDDSGLADWSIFPTSYQNQRFNFFHFRPPTNLLIGVVGEAVDSPRNYPAEGHVPIGGTLEEGLWVYAESTSPFGIPYPPTPKADQPNISDGNFLSGASYSYQWIRVDGATETLIDNPNPRGQGYSLQPADVGKALKVTVSFTDDAGNRESLTSGVTGTVGSALTYQMSNLNQVITGRIIQGTATALAQSFTTGADQKILTKVRLPMGAFVDGRSGVFPGITVMPEVSVYSDYSDTDSRPGLRLLDLINPASVEHNVLTLEDFTTTGLTLAANTKYWVVVRTDQSGLDAKLATLNSTGLDDSSTDWSMGDTIQYFEPDTLNSGEWKAFTQNEVVQMGIVTMDDLPVITGDLEIGGILEPGLTVATDRSQLVIPDGYSVSGVGWILVDGETETAISTPPFRTRYTVQPGDVGKQLKAWYSYRDNLNIAEAQNEILVYSEPTDVVVSASTYLGSNLGEVTNQYLNINTFLPAVAQAFTTGNDSSEVTAVRMQMGAPSGVEPRVSIYSDDSGLPGTSLHLLANPARIDARTSNGALTAEEFTASGVTLSANTKYWVVVESESAELMDVWATDSRDQETGWSIDDSSYRKVSGVWEEYRDADNQTYALKVGFPGVQVLSAPQFDTKPLTIFAVENTTDDSQVIATITASQEDNDPLTYSVGGTDITAFNEDFTIRSTDGAISYKSDATVDHETRPSYTVTVSVTDGEDLSGNLETVPTIDDMVTVTINVTNVDEAGTAALDQATPAVGRIVEATLNDQDGGVESPAWTWAWSTTRTGSFTTITGANSATYRPASGDQGRYLKASVTYTDSFGAGKTAEVTSNAVAANPPPVFDDNSPTFTLNENATSGTVGTVTARDPDSEAVTYSVGGADAAAFNEDFSLGSTNGAITVKPVATIDHESRSSYSVTITATDAMSITATATVTINVTDVDDAGTVDLTVDTPVVGKQLTATLSDQDGGLTGETWSWSWSTTRTGSFTPISGANAAIYTPVTADAGRFLKAAVIYTDSFGAGKTAEMTSANAVAPNPPPTFANPSVAFAVNENATSGTVGTVTATDPDSDPITYSVGGGDVAAFNEDFSLGSTSGAITVKPVATIDHEGRPSYSVTITVTDPYGGADTIGVTINVTDVDEPGAVALSTATPAVGKSLTATLSDPDGSVTGRAWIWAWSTTRTGSFTTISGANAAIYTPVTADAGRFLKATVTYTDSFGSRKTAAVTSNAVAPNPPPTFDAASVAFAVNENATSGTVGTVTATDPDSEAVTYSVGGADAAAFNEDFSLGSTSGAITVKPVATIDHEGRPSYSVTIAATDPYGGADTIGVTINVTDVDEPGAVALSTATPAVGKSLTATLSDPDGSVTGRAWIWAWSTTRTGSFTTISGANAAIYTPVTADAGRFLKATVTYTDSFGSRKTAAVTSNAVAPNPPPTFDAASVAFAVNENATSGTVGTVTATDPDSEAVTYSVGGADAAAFNEDFSLGSTSGAITVKPVATIDHEGRPSYSVTIAATDPFGGANTIGVTINVTDVDEPGTVALAADTPAVGKSLTATLSDPDGSVTGRAWSWAWSTTRTGSFTPISGSNAAIYTPVTADAGRFLKATVTYTDSLGPGKSASQTAVNATVANPPPTFANPSVTFAVNENATSGTVGTVTATDPDSEAVTYSVGGADAAAFNEDFSLGSTSGAITVKPVATIDHEGRPSYSVTIAATDPFGGANTIGVTINVTDVDEPGTVALAADTPAVGKSLTATLSDPDGSVTGRAWSWAWSTTRTGSFTPISGSNAAIYTPVTADAGRFLKATVTYTDSLGPGKSASQTAVNATVANPPPTFANPSVTFAVNENATSGTVGTVTATDPDSEAVTYSVGGADAAAFNEDFSLGSTSGAIMVKPVATIDHEGRPSYSVRIAATDPFGGANTIGVTINVTNVDEAGEVSLSAATPVVGKSLTATLSDPDGSVTGRAWSWAWSTTRTGSFTPISGANAAIYTPVTADAGRFLKATVTYTDSLGPGKSASQTAVNATVANPPPTFANPSVAFAVNENATSGTVGTVTATDPDSEAVTYSVGGADAAAFNEDFSLGSTSGAIMVKPVATIDHEGRPSYSVSITATDSHGGTDTIDVTLNVTDLDDQGEVSLSAATPAVGKSLTATLSDPDGSVTGRAWSWAWSTTRTGSFTPISGSNAAIYTPVTADAGRFLKATVTYTDSLGPGKSASQTAVNATVANPPPTFANPSVTFAVNENATSGTVGTVTATDPDSEAVTYSVGGADAAAFNEDFSLGSTSGAIMVKPVATIDHEGRPSYSVTIAATDPFGGANTIGVTINVTNVDEAGVVALSQASPAVGKSLTATLSDPDGSVTSSTWTWSRGSSRTGSFTPISGAANAATYTPVTADVGRFLRATVSYTDSFDSGKSAEMTSTNAVLANPPPVFTNSSPAFTVNENATSGTVGTVTATDPDSEAVTYSVGGADAAAFNEDFSLGSTSGAITVKPVATIDHETKPSYAVTITATDTAGVTAAADVTINVTDVDEAGTLALTVATPAMGKSLTATLSDPDGSVTGPTWSWAWSTTRTGSFTPISGSNAASYTPVTADVGRFLKATVSYTDSFGAGKSAETVSDNAVATNPPPVFADPSVTFTVNENATSGTVGTVTATDPDSDPVTYSVGGADAAAFNEDFSLGSTSGTIMVKPVATIDHEGRPSYSVSITATDSHAETDTIDVTINVTDLDDPGKVSLSAATPAVGGAFTATLSDPDGSVTSPTWTWSWATTRTGSFTPISGANTATYTPVTADADRFLKATVSYTDSLGSGKSAEMTSANAVATNPPPVFANSSPTFAVKENATSGTVGTVTATDPDSEAVTYSVGGADAAAFNRDFSLGSTSGAISVKPVAAIDHESKPSYAVTITATDTAGVTAAADVTINVTDVDEAGTVALSVVTPAVGRQLTATLSDPDGGVTGRNWRWSRGRSRTGSFTPISGAANAATYAPVTADVGRFLKATVSYTDSFGAGKSAETVSDNAVATNPPPVFADPSVTFTVNENAMTGTVGTVTATDPDSDPITYSVGGGRRGGVQRGLQPRLHQRDDHGQARCHHRPRDQALVRGHDHSDGFLRRDRRHRGDDQRHQRR